MYRPLLLLVCYSVISATLGSFAIAQQSDSAVRELMLRNARISADLASAKAITKLPQPAFDPAEPPVEFDKIVEGWIGGMAFVQCEIVSITGADAMLIRANRDNIIWLKGISTKDLTTDQKIRLYGPLKAGPTESYTTAAGSSRTVRTFKFAEGEEQKKYLDSLITKLEMFQKLIKQQQEEDSRREVEAAIKDVVKTIIWGKQDPRHPRGMEKLVLKKYKEELEQVGRYIKVSKITAGLSSPMTYDPKKKRIEFDSEQSKTIAADHLKSLLADIPK